MSLRCGALHLHQGLCGERPLGLAHNACGPRGDGSAFRAVGVLVPRMAGRGRGWVDEMLVGSESRQRLVTPRRGASIRKHAPPTNVLRSVSCSLVAICVHKLRLSRPMVFGSRCESRWGKKSATLAMSRTVSSCVCVCVCLLVPAYGFGIAPRLRHHSAGWSDVAAPVRHSKLEVSVRLGIGVGIVHRSAGVCCSDSAGCASTCQPSPGGLRRRGGSAAARVCTFCALWRRFRV